MNKIFVAGAVFALAVAQAQADELSLLSDTNSADLKDADASIASGATQVAALAESQLLASAKIVQSGDGNSALIDQTGARNHAAIVQAGNSAVAMIVQTGNDNRATILQH